MSASILQRSPTAAAPDCVLVAGANGGIGRALCEQIAIAYPRAHLIRLARDPEQLPNSTRLSQDIACDICDEESIRSAIAQIDQTQRIDWALLSTGWLHDTQHQPEKTYKALSSDALLKSYQINAIGPALLVKHLVPRLHKTDARVGVLSARVGSISDNRLGGWHAYRSSKAALNMLIKNFALELARKPHSPIVVGLQPGTTDTPLSEPFQRSVPADQLQSPTYTATQLLKVMAHLTPEDSGRLFDFFGLEFAP